MVAFQDNLVGADPNRASWPVKHTVRPAQGATPTP
jgi:hypothetical protein